MQQVGTYQRLVVKPISGALGAEVEGVDLGQLDALAFAEINRAFADHLVLFFRDQRLTQQQFESFGARFGQLSITYYVEPIEGSKYLQRLVREAFTGPLASPRAGRGGRLRLRRRRPLGGRLHRPRSPGSCPARRLRLPGGDRVHLPADGGRFRRGQTTVSD